ncbi:MAG: SDR family oxidoreductase [Alphaproteobacteria bacterium]
MTGDSAMGGVLVTGAARRIGKAIAEALAGDGWRVAVHYNTSRTDAEETVAAIRARGGMAEAVQADLGDEAALQALIALAGAAVGPLTCLINNASRFEYDDIVSLSATSWDRHMAVNLRAPALLSRDFAAAMRAGDEGVIVNILDQKVGNENPDFLSYSVSKMGLEALTRLLALALAPRIRVCGIAPGLTLPSGGQTPESFAKAHALSPLGQGSTVQEIVRCVQFAISARAMTGQTIMVDGGQHLQKRAHDVMFEVFDNDEEIGGDARADGRDGA